MPEPCAAAPSATPTTGIYQIPLLRALVRTDCPENAERALALLAGLTLCFGLVVLILAVWWQSLMNDQGHVDGTLVTALFSLSASVAVLAGYIHRSAGPTAAPAAGGGQ